MKTIDIEGMHPKKVKYFTPEEVVALKAEDPIFTWTLQACGLLQIDIPNVALGNILPAENPDTGEISERRATTWWPEELPELDLPLSYYGVQYPNGIPFNNHVVLSGLVDHEMRHIWQEKYHPEKYGKKAVGFLESLYNLAEIDADGFAIAVVSRGEDMETIGRQICPYEYKLYPDAFRLRMKRAEEILAEYKGSNHQKTPSFWKRIKSRLFRIRKGR